MIVDKLKFFKRSFGTTTARNGSVSTKVESAGKKRKVTLYTDHIYPYPFNYFNNKIFPSQVLYRESWRKSAWHDSDNRLGIYIMRVFWTWWFYQAFWHPDAFIGHFTFPDASKWTDEELGIPPDEEGSYYEKFQEN